MLLPLEASCSVLRENNCRVRPQPNSATHRHAVRCRPMRLCVVAEPIAKVGVITRPVTVQAYTPAPATWETNGIARIALIAKIKHHNDIIPTAALIPAMKSHHFISVVDMMDVHILAAQATRIIEPIASQTNQVAIQLGNARECRGIGPIERGVIIEPSLG